MYQRILVPVDGSPTSDRGLQEAIRLARLTHGELRLIHVIDELSFALGIDSYGYYAGELLDLLRKDGAAILQHAADTAREHGVTVDSVLYENLEKTVQQRVIAEAEMWKADLIVIGTHGRRASAAWCWAAAPRTSCAARPFPCCCVRQTTPPDPARDAGLPGCGGASSPCRRRGLLRQVLRHRRLVPANTMREVFCWRW